MFNKDHRVLLSAGITMLGLSLGCMSDAYAAKPIELKVQSMKSLQSVLAPTKEISFVEVSQATDMQKITHVRYQEYYKNYPVMGADVVVHQANPTLGKTDSSINGVIYQDLNADLQNAPAQVFSSAQAKKAEKLALQSYTQSHTVAGNVSAPASKLMVYIDESNKAHWAFLINFDVTPASGMPAKPHFIMDATSFHIYAQWDEIKTADNVVGGGFGGNTKMGKLVYDGLNQNLPALDFSRDEKNTCFLANGAVIVKDMRKRKQGDYELMQFICQAGDPDHGGLYWNADFDKANGAFSPANDALYAGKVIKEMYEKWYGVPPLVTKDGEPKVLVMRVHEKMENAYWDGEQMTFGDGGSTFFPLTSLGVSAHEVSHGFTEQHSNLFYSNAQSGGLNESFSDMAAQAAEYYSTGKNSWEIGPEIFKKEGEALRYMNDPTKDCHGQKPGTWCSIDHMSQFNSRLDVHYTSGIFNKVFYLMGSAPDWNTKKAFDVMVKANMAYWRPKTTFAMAANCVLKATHDLEYNDAAVVNAFEAVGIKNAKADLCV